MLTSSSPPMVESPACAAPLPGSFPFMETVLFAFRKLIMKPLLDPRNGDVEDDASSTKQRSLVSLAGSLLAEVSLP